MAPSCLIAGGDSGVNMEKLSEAGKWIECDMQPPRVLL